MPNDLKNPQNVLVIDNELQDRKLLKHTLDSAGYAVIETDRGEAGLAEAAVSRPDLVILDLNLPDIPGIQVIARLREWSSVYVMVLSANASQREKISSMDSGADDYLTKPFDPEELLARMRVLSRRQQPGMDPVLARFGNVEVDLTGQNVTKNGREIPLTSMEFAVLCLLLRNRGRIMTHKHILKDIWGPGGDGHKNYLRVYMRRLRQKLEDDPNRPAYLLTVHGFGYRLNVKQPQSLQPSPRAHLPEGIESLHPTSEFHSPRRT
jgi:two-component system KDP operon response regulator KdpE